MNETFVFLTNTVRFLGMLICGVKMQLQYSGSVKFLASFSPLKPKFSKLSNKTGFGLAQ